MVQQNCKWKARSGTPRMSCSNATDTSGTSHISFSTVQQFVKRSTGHSFQQEWLAPGVGIRTDRRMAPGVEIRRMALDR
eukprot:3424147-Amphidinium_carterae.1